MPELEDGIDETACSAHIRGCGIQNKVTYVGSCEILRPASEMSEELRIEVLMTCIRKVTAANSNGSNVNEEENSYVNEDSECEKAIGPLQMHDCPAEMNINDQSLVLINNDPTSPMYGRLLHKYYLDVVALAARAPSPLDPSIVAYIGKKNNGTDRRCIVLRSDDAGRLLTYIKVAINCHVIDKEKEERGEHFSLLTKPVSAVAKDLEDRMWFHGEMDRGDAERLLIKKGDFLVRRSAHKQDPGYGPYVLSAYDANGKQHVVLVSDGKVASADRRFDSIVEMIEYYMKTREQLSADSVQRMVLINPVMRR